MLEGIFSSFWYTKSNATDIKIEMQDFYNHGHNILELYNVLIQTRLTTSKTKRDI